VTRDCARGALLGLAVGDAIGTTAEFQPRGTFTPLTGIVGGGPFGLDPGQWTDDTSMALCLAASLAETGRFDLRDQIDRYCRWQDDGYLSCTGRCLSVLAAGERGQIKEVGQRQFVPRTCRT
jgi:ADP-ribosyl-[dinitrogen reductase] hydrolase